MRHETVYVDSSVIGGCEDPEFSQFSLALWDRFIMGECTLVLSELTLTELGKAPDAVRARLREVPAGNQIVLDVTDEAKELADAYLKHGVLGPGSRPDALHVAIATVGKVDVVASWNFKHIVNLGKIRLFNSVNLELGYGLIEIRTPQEVLRYE